jgi:hypothetical protein
MTFLYTHYEECKEEDCPVTLFFHVNREDHSVHSNKMLKRIKNKAKIKKLLMNFTSTLFKRALIWYFSR